MIGQFFDGVDVCLAWVLADTGRIIVWACLAGAGSLALYALISPQRRLKRLEEESALVQSQLSRFEGDFADALPLIRANLSLALKRLALVLGPSLAAGAPAILIWIWVDDRYGCVPPRPGDHVAVELHPAPAILRWDSEWDVQERGPGAWQIRWPELDRSTRLRDANGAVLLTLPSNVPVATIYRHSWWEEVIGSRAGTLPDESSIQKIVIECPPREMLPFGPAWFRSYVTGFFIAACVSSLTVKRIFRIA